MIHALVLALGVFFAAPSPAHAVGPIDTEARAAFLLDMSSGAVLLDKNADAPLPPASMSKLMTVNMVFEALRAGRLSLDDTFPVSEKAWRMGGSKMFVKVDSRVSVHDLLRGVIVQSGNDACVVLAEGLAGSEEEFAARMTRRARELGLRSSKFANATGWPDPGQQMSLRDLATLGARLITEFPEYYTIFSETEFTWSKIVQKNRNPLLYLNLGADGLKTGHTEEAGYGLVGSAIRDGRRLILVISGLPSQRARSQEAESILNWGFREFETFTAVEPGIKLGDIDIWIGDQPTAPLTVASPVRITAPWGAKDKIKSELVYDSPIEAPVSRGQVVGVLRLTAPDLPPVEAPLIVAADVARGGFVQKVKAGASLLIRHIMPGSGEAKDGAQ